MLPPAESTVAQRFNVHRQGCDRCRSFDGELRNLNVLCLQGTRLLKDDWIELEAARRRRRNAA